MPIWVRVLCRKPVPVLSGADLRDGIAARLPVLTALLSPDEAEDPAAVLARLVIEEHDLVWRPGGRPVQMEVWTDPAMVHEEIDELLAHHVPDALRERVAESVASVAFELGFPDRDTMAWPVAIAAACEVAERADGVIHEDEAGWMVPDGHEVRYVA